MIHIFIINTQVVDTAFSDNLREHLSKRNNFKYFTFNTSHAGMEAEITRKMIRFFDGERIRFYCCGGSGTLRNVMDASGDYKDMEVAFYPCGETNDFLKVFGKDEQYFHDIDNLIDGHVGLVDYIKTNYGVALNTISLGIDTTLVDSLEKYADCDIFGKKVPQALSYAKSIIGLKPRKLQIKIDRNIITKNVTELVIGNGIAFGGSLYFSDYANYHDGKVDYLVALDSNGIDIVKLMMKLVKRDIPYLRENTYNGKGSVFEISTTDGSELDFNLDGEIIRGGSEWKMEVIKQGMSFVIPKGVGIL